MIARLKSLIFLDDYLVSASKDKTIRLWDRKSFSCAKTLKLPKASGYKGKRQSQDDSARIWTTLAPAGQPASFISSGQGHGSQQNLKKIILTKNNLFLKV